MFNSSDIVSKLHSISSSKNKKGGLYFENISIVALFKQNGYFSDEDL